MNRISKKLNRKAEIDENSFDSLNYRFYEGTKKYFDKEEQDKIWNGEYSEEEAAKNLNEKEMDRFLNLLNKYGLIENYHDKIMDVGRQGPFMVSYLELMLYNYDIKDEDNLFKYLKEWENIIEKDPETYGYLIYVLNEQNDFNHKEVDYIVNNFSYEIIEKFIIACDYMDKSEIKATFKTHYCDEKILIILDGFENGLSVEEIKDKIKEELPEKEW